MAVEWWAVGLILAATGIGAFGPIFLKIGSQKKLRSLSSLRTNYYLWAGIGCYGVGTVLFIPALKGGDLSVLYPLVSISYIWVSLLSMKILGEKMNWMKWVGIMLIIIGVSFIGFGS